MDVLEAIRVRKSIRGFKPDPVPQGILKEIIEIGCRAPSSMNTQPWIITVVTGEVLDKIKRGNVELLASGAIPDADVPLQPFQGKYRQRQVDLAIEIFKLMGINREDRKMRKEWQKRGFRFFDAPAAIILSVEKSVGESHSQFDLGALAQTICLVALTYGLGTCIADQCVMFPEVIREFIPIPESQRIVVGIAIGYPDWDLPANRLDTGREPLGNIVTWYC